jgi:hypothetical protein
MSDDFPLLHDPPGHDEPKDWTYRIPIIGWICSCGEQLDREKALTDQAVQRGPVPESAWEQYEYSKEVRSKIEGIVRRHAYPKGSTFHPLDPVELMFVLRYGDLNEVQIMMEIEGEFQCEFSDEFGNRLITEHTTFIDFIRMVEAGRLAG